MRYLSIEGFHKYSMSVWKAVRIYMKSVRLTVSMHRNSITKRKRYNHPILYFQANLFNTNKRKHSVNPVKFQP